MNLSAIAKDTQAGGLSAEQWHRVHRNDGFDAVLRDIAA